MAVTCTHLDTVREVTPSAEGCEDCLRTGDRWVHLRICQSCGHVGLLRQLAQPARHRPLRRPPDHPIIRSFEPGEDWWWCYQDELAFEVPGARPAPSHP